MTSAQASRAFLWKWKTPFQKENPLLVAAWLHLSACTSHELLKRLQPLSDITNPHPAGMREQIKKKKNTTHFYTVLCPPTKPAPSRGHKTRAGQCVQRKPTPAEPPFTSHIPTLLSRPLEAGLPLLCSSNWDLEDCSNQRLNLVDTQAGTTPGRRCSQPGTFLPPLLATQQHSLLPPDRHPACATSYCLCTPRSLLPTTTAPL